MAKQSSGGNPVGNYWTLTFENVSQRAISRPDSVFTWGGVIGSFEELKDHVESFGGWIDVNPIFGESGLETSDVKDLTFCVPCELFDKPPSDEISWTLPIAGSRAGTGRWKKKTIAAAAPTRPECVKARILQVGRDNGVTPGSSSNTAGTRPDWIRFNWEFISKGILVDGELRGVGQVIGGATGWTPQFTDDTGREGKDGTDLSTWVPYLNSVYNDESKYCTAFGFKPKPTWRYANTTTVDPCAVFDDWKLCRTDLPEGTPAEETEYTIHPVLVESEEVTVWRYWKFNPNGQKELVYCREVDGGFEDIDAPTWVKHEGAEPVPIPSDCYIPCDEKFLDPIAEGAGSRCTTTLQDGCEIKPAVLDPDTFDPIEPAVAVTTGLLIALQVCEDGSIKSFGYTVDEDGNAEPHELPDPNPDGNFFGDCDTLDAFPDPVADPTCKPPGKYSGATFCYEKKGKFVLIEKQFGGKPGTVDVSADLGLPVGSVIATTDSQLWTGASATIAAAAIDSPVKFSVAGTQKVCIRVQHGGAIPTDGASDGMTANDGVPYAFTGNITGDGSLNQIANDYSVTSGTDNSQGALNWTSQGPATEATAWTTNGNPFNSVRFWVAVFECAELREWIDDCGELSGWYDGDKLIAKTTDGLTESDCCKNDCCGNDDLIEFLSQFKTTCKNNAIPDADFSTATTYINGRPPASQGPWELVNNLDPANQIVEITGANLGEFDAALAAAGFTTWSFGEQHFFCPCPPKLVGQPQGSYFVRVAGTTISKLGCQQLADLPNAPEKQLIEIMCALRTKDCNSDAQLLVSQQILEALLNTCVCKEVKIKYPDTKAGCLKALQWINPTTRETKAITLIDGTDVLSLIEECGIELEYVDPCCDCDCDSTIQEPDCPELVLDDTPTYTNDVVKRTDADANNVTLFSAGDPVSFPMQAGPNFLTDFTHCLRMTQSCCLLRLDPELKVTLRANFDYELVGDGSHTGFNGNPGPGTIVATSPNNSTSATIGGPFGVRDDHWVDIEYRLGDLLSGDACLSTGALGTSNSLSDPYEEFGPNVREVIYAYSVTVSPDFLQQLLDILAACPCPNTRGRLSGLNAQAVGEKPGTPTLEAVAEITTKRKLDPATAGNLTGGVDPALQRNVAQRLQTLVKAFTLAEDKAVEKTKSSLVLAKAKVVAKEPVKVDTEKSKEA